MDGKTPQEEPESGGKVGEISLAQPSDISKSTVEGRGSLWAPEYMTRNPKMYPMPKLELDSLGDLALHTTIWASVGSMSLSAAISCIWSWVSAIAPGASPPAMSWPAKTFMWAAFVISAIAYGLAAFYWLKKGNHIAKIMEECKSPTTFG